MSLETPNTQATNEESTLAPNELRAGSLASGQIALVHVDGEPVAVFNAEGTFYATQDRCPHIGYPLSDGGDLSGTQVTCAMHGWCFDVATGEVMRGMRTLKLRTFRVELEGDIVRVLPDQVCKP
jgi:nitrite reductase/ring-hydroxylating ferredoxin subunit